MKEVIEYKSLVGADLLTIIKGIIEDLKECKIPNVVGKIKFNGVELEIKPSSDVDDLWKLYHSGLRIIYLERVIKDAKINLVD